MSNPLKKLASQTAIYGLPTIIGRLLSYLLTPLYTYNFSTGEYGVVTSAYAYVSFLLVLLTYGMETALFRFSQSEPDKQKVYTTSLISLFFSSTSFILLVFIFATPIAGSIRFTGHPEYVIWFAIILGTDAFAAVPFAKLREQGKAKRFAFVKTVNICVYVGLNLFFILFCRNVSPDSFLKPFVDLVYNPKIGIGYIFISNLIASIVTLVLLSPEILKVRYVFDSPLWKKMMRYALPLLIAGLAGMVNETLDRILLTHMLPEKEAMSQTGIYGACYKVSIIMTIFIQTFRFAAEPFFFSHSTEKDATKTYADIMKYFVIVCSLIFLGTMLNIHWIQYFAGSAAFRTGISVVPILLMANFCLGIYYNQSIWYKLTGQTHYGALLAIFGAVITIVLNIYWIPRIGYMGCAWATLICYASMMVASYFMGNKHYPVNYDLKRILGYMGLSVTLYGLSTFIHTGSAGLNLVLNNLLLLGFIALVLKIEVKNFRKLT
ncbi:MAG: polysaccharide biosynthesis protein [Bacteroidetes bacterium]|nr:polysaccharide biosynthesis protein [Bacteroidota bacterium]